MNVAAGPRLAAAVTNAGVFQGSNREQQLTPYPLPCTGGIGVIGGMRYSPRMLRQGIDDLKAQLEDKNAPFGIDLAIPQVGGGARKTNVRPSILLVFDGPVCSFFRPLVRLYQRPVV
jgi:hypothetical protein